MHRDKRSSRLIDGFGVLVIGKQLLQTPRVVVQEVVCDGIVFRVFVSDFAHTRTVELNDLGVGVGQQNGRVRGYDELRLVFHQLVYCAEGGHLPAWRERRLGLVEQVDAIPAQLVHQHSHERLSVRPVVQRATISSDVTCLVRVGRDVEEALGSEEVAVLRLRHPASDTEGFVQRRHGLNRAELDVFRTAFWPETKGNGNGLQHRRFARAVLANEERHVRMEGDVLQLADGGDVEGIRIEVEVSVRTEGGVKKVGSDATGHWDA